MPTEKDMAVTLWGSLDETESRAGWWARLRCRLFKHRVFVEQSEAWGIIFQQAICGRCGRIWRTSEEVEGAKKDLTRVRPSDDLEAAIVADGGEAGELYDNILGVEGGLARIVGTSMDDLGPLRGKARRIIRSSK